MSLLYLKTLAAAISIRLILFELNPKRPISWNQLEVGALDLCLGGHAGRQYRAITVEASIGRQRANGEPTKSVDVLYGATP